MNNTLLVTLAPLNGPGPVGGVVVSMEDATAADVPLPAESDTVPLHEETIRRGLGVSSQAPRGDDTFARNLARLAHFMPRAKVVIFHHADVSVDPIFFTTVATVARAVATPVLILTPGGTADFPLGAYVPHDFAVPKQNLHALETLIRALTGPAEKSKD